MSIGNLKDQGNKGNNFPYQRAVLELLSNISTSTGAPCCPTAATEQTLEDVNNTLGAILGAVQGGSVFFNNLVIDTGSPACASPAGCPTYSEVKVWNGTSFTTTYYNASGGVVVPVGPLVYVNPQYVLNDILLQAIAINASTTSIDTKSTSIVTNTGNTASSTGSIDTKSTSIVTNTGATATSTSNIDTNTVPVLGRTPTMIRTSVAGTVTAGKRSVSFRNAGSANATVLGANLLPGETVNFDAGALKDTLGAIAYSGVGTDLLIITIA